MPRRPTPMQTLIDDRLRARGLGSLLDYIAERRQQGKSFELIARDIRDDTGITASSVTVSNWYFRMTEPDDPAEAPQALAG